MPSPSDQIRNPPTQPRRGATIPKKTPYRIDRVTLHGNDDIQVVRDLVRERSLPSSEPVYVLYPEQQRSARSLEDALDFIKQHLTRRYATVEVMLRNTLDVGNTRSTDFTHYVEVIINIPHKSHLDVMKILEQHEQQEESDAYYEELHSAYYADIMY